MFQISEYAVEFVLHKYCTNILILILIFDIAEISRLRKNPNLENENDNSVRVYVGSLYYGLLFYPIIPALNYSIDDQSHQYWPSKLFTDFIYA
jgi:hypothetical protein